MNIEDLTISQIRMLTGLLNDTEPKTKHHLLGKYVLIRTYSAGVWFGILQEKEGNEVVLRNARRLWQWYCKNSISLSGVAKYGINQDKSRIAPDVDTVTLFYIEIIEMTEEAIESLLTAKEAEQS